MAAAAGLLLGAAVAQAAPDDEFSGLDPAPALTLHSQVLRHSPPPLGLRSDGDRDTLASRAHRTPPQESDPTWLPRREFLAHGTLMRAQLSEDASVSMRLRRGRLGVYLAVRLPM